ncbi:MAG: TolC family protein [Waddliaceae bacterium]
MPVFNEVQTNISYRTGQVLVWDKRKESCCEFKDWLESTLKEDLTVEKVVQVALMNNQRLKGTYENLGIAQAQLVQSGLLKNPIFSLSLRYENLVSSANILEMGLVQNLLDILLKPQKKRLACAELALVKSEVSAHVLDVIAEAKIAYHSLQSAEQVLMMRKQVLEATEAAYDVAKRLNEAGNITNLDLVVERSNYEQMKIDVSGAEVALFKARERLNIVMGLWGSNIDWKISQQISFIPDEQMDFDCIESHVIANSLDLQMSKERMRATALSLGIETSEIIFPELTFGPDSEREPGGPWFVGPQFSIGIPIFDIGIAKKAARCAELSKQWNEYTALAIEIRSASRVASFRLLNALKQYQYFQSIIIPLEEQTTKETLLQLNAMQLGVFDLLLVKQREIETRLKSIYSYRDYWIARTEVETLLSGRMIHKMNMVNGQ